MFYSLINLTSLDLSNLDTSKVIYMESMFNACFCLQTLDLSNWNTSKVTNMRWMFNGCNELVYIKGLCNLDTSKVDNIDYMFNNCMILTSTIEPTSYIVMMNPDISSFNDVFVACGISNDGFGIGYIDSATSALVDYLIETSPDSNLYKM